MDHSAEATKRKKADDEARLKALREAARAGIADIEAGRFREFDTLESLHCHLAAVAEHAITCRQDQP